MMLLDVAMVSWSPYNIPILYLEFAFASFVYIGQCPSLITVCVYVCPEYVYMCGTFDVCESKAEFILFNERCD